MKFLLIASYPDSLLNFREDLIVALQARGLIVHVAAPDFLINNPLRKELESKGIIAHHIPLQRTGMNPWQDFLSLLHLFRLMLCICPDFVLAYTVKPVIYGSLAAWLAKVPRRFALITGLGYAFQDNRRRNGLRSTVQSLYVLALARVHKVFFQNPDDEILFRQRGLLRQEVASVVVNGSGVDVFHFDVALLPEQPSFLLIARLLGGKGVREYAEAARRVRSKYPDTRFTLAGWIDESPDAITQHELETWVSDGVLRYLGRLSDVRGAIADSAVYVLPSYREGTPRTVLEAMAMGRAIITTNAPGCRETVVDGSNGFLIPVKSVDALERAMLKFIEDPTLAVRMGARSRQIAENKYDVHKINAVMLAEMGIA
jgi:glycosyltransferase involved in cell wall biosynthesis